MDTLSIIRKIREAESLADQGKHGEARRVLEPLLTERGIADSQRTLLIKKLELFERQKDRATRVMTRRAPEGKSSDSTDHGENQPHSGDTTVTAQPLVTPGAKTEALSLPGSEARDSQRAAAQSGRRAGNDTEVGDRKPGTGTETGGTPPVKSADTEVAARAASDETRQMKAISSRRRPSSGMYTAPSRASDRLVPVQSAEETARARAKASTDSVRAPDVAPPKASGSARRQTAETTVMVPALAPKAEATTSQPITERPEAAKPPSGRQAGPGPKADPAPPARQPEPPKASDPPQAPTAAAPATESRPAPAGEVRPVPVAVQKPAEETRLPSLGDLAELEPSPAAERADEPVGGPPPVTAQERAVEPASITPPPSPAVRGSTREVIVRDTRLPAERALVDVSSSELVRDHQTRKLERGRPPRFTPNSIRTKQDLQQLAESLPSNDISRVLALEVLRLREELETLSARKPVVDAPLPHPPQTIQPQDDNGPDSRRIPAGDKPESNIFQIPASRLNTIVRTAAGGRDLTAHMPTRDETIPELEVLRRDAFRRPQDDPQPALENQSTPPRAQASPPQARGATRGAGSLGLVFLAIALLAGCAWAGWLVYTGLLRTVERDDTALVLDELGAGGLSIGREPGGQEIFDRARESAEGLFIDDQSGLRVQLDKSGKVAAIMVPGAAQARKYRQWETQRYIISLRGKRLGLEGNTSVGGVISAFGLPEPNVTPEQLSRPGLLIIQFPTGRGTVIEFVYLDDRDRCAAVRVADNANVPALPPLP
jgi:hypothetical protein